MVKILMTRWSLVLLLCPCSHWWPPLGQRRRPTDEQAPATFRARFETSQGPFVIEVHREWAPIAADRFFTLVKRGFYNDARFFRVLNGFMAQFGLSGDPKRQAEYASANLMDEPAKQSNLRGFVSFAKESAPNTRYTMVFINYKDNSYLDADGFAPFGQVVPAWNLWTSCIAAMDARTFPISAASRAKGMLI